MALAVGQVHIGRQPIYDASGGVFGYELLFRDHGSAEAAAANGDQATTAVVLNTFTEFGLETLVGGRLAFINVTRPFLVGELPIPFPPQCAVLEILETIEVDDALLEGARRLAAEGYGLALDDFVWDDRLLADYVKLDLQSYGPDKLAELVARLRPYGVRLVAERVETREHLELARSLGFDYFQGWHLRAAGRRTKRRSGRTRPSSSGCCPTSTCCWASRLPPSSRPCRCRRSCGPRWSSVTGRSTYSPRSSRTRTATSRGCQRWGSTPSTPRYLEGVGWSLQTCETVLFA